VGSEKRQKSVTYYLNGPLPAESRPKCVMVPLSGTWIFSRQQKAKSFGASMSCTSREASITKSVILGPIQLTRMTELVILYIKAKSHWDLH
jgi:hypothetical protein